MTLVEGEVAGDSGGVPRDMCGWRGCSRFKFQTPPKKKLLKLKSKLVRGSLNSDTIGIAFCFNKVLKLL